MCVGPAEAGPTSRSAQSYQLTLTSGSVTSPDGRKAESNRSEVSTGVPRGRCLCLPEALSGIEGDRGGIEPPIRNPSGVGVAWMSSVGGRCRLDVEESNELGLGDLKSAFECRQLSVVLAGFVGKLAQKVSGLAVGEPISPAFGGREENRPTPGLRAPGPG